VPGREPELELVGAGFDKAGVGELVAATEEHRFSDEQLEQAPKAAIVLGGQAERVVEPTSVLVGERFDLNGMLLVRHVRPLVGARRVGGSPEKRGGPLPNGTDGAA
jgi:hypothetical protein